jgi:hypothetical protein
LCAHMAEFGIIAAQDLGHVEIPTKTIAHQKERLRRSRAGSCRRSWTRLNGTMGRESLRPGRR